MMSLDEQEFKENITFLLCDSQIKVDAKYFSKNEFLFNLRSQGGEKDYEIKVDLTLNDFLPIFQHLSTNKRPSRGEVVEYEKFFDFCQYIGEIDLPLLVTKDSDFITKWSMTKEDLIMMEQEFLLLSIYTKMDSEKNEKDNLLKSYFDNKFNNKLNEKNGFELFKNLKDISIGYLLFPLTEDLHLKNLKNVIHYPTLLTGYIPKNMFNKVEVSTTNLKNFFNDFPWKSENGFMFLAGGSVLKYLCNYTQYYFTNSDYDIFLITRDENEAVKMINNFYDWFIKFFMVINKQKDYFITRTKNSISFTCDNFIFQIILRLYHTSEQVLCGFDIDPCCLGFDGEYIYTIPRGLKSLQTRTFQAIGWRQSKTMAYRSNKYMKRGFSVCFPGLSNEEFRSINNNENNRKSIISTIINRKAKKQSDYEEAPIIMGINNFNYNIMKIKNIMTYSVYNNIIQVITRNIKTIFDTNYLQQGDIFTLKNSNLNSDTKISFLKEMVHGQISGSFQPTKEEWFKGIKWD